MRDGARNTVPSCSCPNKMCGGLTIGWGKLLQPILVTCEEESDVAAFADFEPPAFVSGSTQAAPPASASAPAAHVRHIALFSTATEVPRSSINGQRFDPGCCSDPGHGGEAGWRSGGPRQLLVGQPDVLSTRTERRTAYQDTR